MRFIDTSSLQLRELVDSDIAGLENGYAILSHTWIREEEVSYKDMKAQTPEVLQKQGYQKLRGACAEAKSLGHDLIWIDTCCINKESAVELSEAIRSMYRWYNNAAVCIAYLQDVGDGLITLSKSRWFRRGWTLQELVAPPIVRFYNHQWDHLGDKCELLTVLSSVTRIPKVVLQDPSRIRQCSVAQRMSWAAGRETTRPEDVAYCLVGLFNVTLLPDYGERDQAFIRLQEAIANRQADDTIFAWHMSDAKRTRGYSGLFATSPDEFAKCGRYVSPNPSQRIIISNVGVTVSFPTRPYSPGAYLALLNATDEQQGGALAIILAKLKADGQYTRICNSQGSDIIQTISQSRWTSQSVSVHQDSQEVAVRTFPGFWLRKLEPPGHDKTSTTVVSCGEASEADRVVIQPGISNVAGTVLFSSDPKYTSSGWSRIQSMKFGFDDDFNPVCRIANRISRDEAKLEQPQSQKMRAALLEKQWMETEGVTPVLGRKWEVGFCILKGDSGGLSCELPGINLQISIRLCPDERPTTLSNSGTVWTVDVSDIQHAYNPEREHSKFWCLEWTSCIIATIPVFTGCACWYVGYRKAIHNNEMECCC